MRNGGLKEGEVPCADLFFLYLGSILMDVWKTLGWPIALLWLLRGEKALYFTLFGLTSAAGEEMQAKSRKTKSKKVTALKETPLLRIEDWLNKY